MIGVAIILYIDLCLIALELGRVIGIIEIRGYN
jgi:hypothetical protein